MKLDKEKPIFFDSSQVNNLCLNSQKKILTKLQKLKAKQFNFFSKYSPEKTKNLVKRQNSFFPKSNCLKDADFKKFILRHFEKIKCITNLFCEFKAIYDSSFCSLVSAKSLQTNESFFIKMYPFKSAKSQKLLKQILVI